MSDGLFTIRAAKPDDAPDIVRLINELAAYEKLADESEPDPQALRRHLAEDASPGCEALLAVDTESKRTVGFALFFPNYSTFLTRFGIYLEDLFVEPSYRGRGIGFALLTEICRIADRRGCRRLDWSVLKWNEPAINFYRQLGAKALSGWTTMRLEGDLIGELASEAGSEKSR